MTSVEALEMLESAGGAIRLDGEAVKVKLPRNYPEVQRLLGELRNHRGEVTALLRQRANRPSRCPSLPQGVRLVKWDLKEPPLAIDTCSVVTNPALFASTTLAQLRAALANPKRWVGWSVPQLIDRLAQVGVTVALETDKSPNLAS